MKCKQCINAGIECYENKRERLVFVREDGMCKFIHTTRVKIEDCLLKGFDPVIIEENIDKLGDEDIYILTTKKWTQ